MYAASGACLRSLVGSGSSEAMAIPRHTLDALQALPAVSDLSIDERCHVLGMSSINAWNRNGFSCFDGYLCHGPSDVHLFSRSLSTRCCAALASALASNVRVTALFLDGSTLADSGCSALCLGLASNRSLTHLSMSNCMFTVEACRDLSSLLAKPGGPPLLVLDISRNSVLNSGAALIGEGLKQASLACASSSNHPGFDASRDDHCTPPALLLRVLRASHCAFSREGAFALCAGVQAASSNGCLHTLDLARNQLGKAGVGYVAWLLQSQGNGLKHIDVRECATAECCAGAMATALHVAANLEVSCKVPVLSNGLKEGRDLFFVDGVAYDVHGCIIEEAMVMQPQFQLHLHTLHIGGSSGSSHEEHPQGFDSLFKSIGRLNCISNLSVSKSPISRSLESHAAELFMCRSLRSISLDGCFISPGGASAMAQGMKRGRCVLQHLSVQGCQLGDIGTGHLVCVWTEGAGPATLNVSSNGIHDRGALHLSRIISSGCLRACFVDDNSIGAEGFAFMCDAVCCSTSRVQLLHVNTNNVGAAGASHLFRNLGRRQPLEIASREVEQEEAFVTSRGTRVARELADLQKEHEEDTNRMACSAQDELAAARGVFAARAAATATCHGKYRPDAEEYMHATRRMMDGEGGGEWCWLERVEMRSNGVGPECEHDLVQMLGTNSTLQVVGAHVACADAVDTLLQCLDVRFNAIAATKQARLLLQLRAFPRKLTPTGRLWTSGTRELCAGVCCTECLYMPYVVNVCITVLEAWHCYSTANTAATSATALATRQDDALSEMAGS